jgi:AcrR family transcriptional regulator
MSLIAERRREEKEQRRESVIDAAEQVFAQKGFEDSTINDVARQARLSRALVYFYFKDKDDVQTAITLRALSALRRSCERAAAKHKLGIEKLVAVSRAYYDFSRSEPFYFKAIARREARQSAASVPGGYESACIAEGGKTMRVLADAIKTGIEDGSIDPTVGAPAVMAAIMWGFLHGVIQVSSSKEPLLRKAFQIDAGEMVERSLELCRRALSAK